MPMIAAAIVSIACLVLTGCSELGASTGVGAEVPVNEGAGAQLKPTPSQSDSGSPGTNPAKQNPGASENSPSSHATISLAALDQPKSVFSEPKFPPPPKESAAELDRLEYELEKVVWASAGVVDKKAKTSCDIRETDLIKVGKLDFDCSVTSSGTKVNFKVNTTVTKSNLDWGWRAPWLPVSEDKAVYEATRQSFRPARVTCDIVGVELVRVDKSDGLTCWVTDIHNKRTTYRGELILDKEKGKLKFLLVFKPAKS
jgi:hypothetical protein